MFGIWWTPVHKKEFVALWASLTNANNGNNQVRMMIHEKIATVHGCKDIELLFNNIIGLTLLLGY